MWAIHDCFRAVSKPGPCPIFGDVEWNLLIDADRICLTSLLVPRAGGTPVDSRFAAFRIFSLLFRDQFSTLLTDPIEQNVRRFVARILRDESALDGLLENRARQIPPEAGIYSIALSLVFQADRSMA